MTIKNLMQMLKPRDFDHFMAAHVPLIGIAIAVISAILGAIQVLVPSPVVVNIVMPTLVPTIGVAPTFTPYPTEPPLVEIVEPTTVTTTVTMRTQEFPLCIRSDTEETTALFPISKVTSGQFEPLLEFVKTNASDQTLASKGIIQEIRNRFDPGRNLPNIQGAQIPAWELNGRVHAYWITRWDLTTVSGIANYRFRGNDYKAKFSYLLNIELVEDTRHREGCGEASVAGVPSSSLDEDTSSDQAPIAQSSAPEIPIPPTPTSAMPATAPLVDVQPTDVGALTSGAITPPLDAITNALAGALPSTALAVPASDATLLAAPLLLSPSDGTRHEFSRVQFAWAWPHALEPDWGFEIRAWRQGDSHDALVDARTKPELVDGTESVYSLDVTLPEGFRNAQWFWTVAVVKLEPYARIGDEALPSRINVDPAGFPVDISAAGVHTPTVPPDALKATPTPTTPPSGALFVFPTATPAPAQASDSIFPVPTNAPSSDTGATATETPTPGLTDTPQPTVDLGTETPTETATDTPLPTDTPAPPPTDTPLPTDTPPPPPTDTAEPPPTDTPGPPTDTPASPEVIEDPPADTPAPPPVDTIGASPDTPVPPVDTPEPPANSTEPPTDSAPTTNATGAPPPESNEPAEPTDQATDTLPQT